MISFDAENMLPAPFLAKMADLLGADYADFVASYGQPAHVGLRVNSLKITAADFSSISPFALKPVGAYAPAGFLVEDGSKPGSHPYHTAGLYYLQEPSAMAVAGLVGAQPGEWVLDLAAAPGGKSTHLSALMQDSGLLVANDIDGRRAAILAENLVRWGSQQMMVTQAHPEQLVRQFGPVFDRVLVDAPCSGEGMFRRVGQFEWSQANVLACGRRQTAVLQSAAQLVKAGGRLIYATCTFSPEENEDSIGQFLAAHPQFELVEPSRFDGFGRGRPSWAASQWAVPSLERAVRLWPHRFVGEGHFVAVMRCTEAVGGQPLAKAWQPERPRPLVLQAWRRFAEENLRLKVAEARLLQKQDRLYLLPETAVQTGHLKLVRYGLLLGEVRSGYFKPDHALALALKGDEVQTAVDFAANSAEVAAYLAGHPLPLNGAKGGRHGWALVTVDGFALGWGKISEGQLKNHYPRGLRQQVGRAERP